MKDKKLITVAIDSPAAAGAGTQAKLIAKHYNLFKLETGMIYRLIGNMRLKNPKKFNYNSVKKTMLIVNEIRITEYTSINTKTLILLALKANFSSKVSSLETTTL